MLNVASATFKRKRWCYNFVSVEEGRVVYENNKKRWPYG